MTKRMKNPYYNQNVAMRGIVEKQFPNGLDTTMELLLAFMSKSNDERSKDMAAFIKISEKSEEIGKVFNFFMSHLQPEVTPISESVYDKGIDGIKELNDHMADKYGKDDNTKLYAEASNLFCWLVLRLPAKEELKRLGLLRTATGIINT